MKNIYVVFQQYDDKGLYKEAVVGFETRELAVEYVATNTWNASLGNWRSFEECYDEADERGEIWDYTIVKVRIGSIKDIPTELYD